MEATLAVGLVLLTGATTLAVTIYERHWVAREERQRWERAERRGVYGRFLGAVFLLGVAESAGDEAQAAAQIDALGVAFSELELVGGDEVGPIAMAIVQVIFGESHIEDQAERLGELRTQLALAARRELGVARP